MPIIPPKSADKDKKTTAITGRAGLEKDKKTAPGKQVQLQDGKNKKLPAAVTTEPQPPTFTLQMQKAKAAKVQLYTDNDSNSSKSNGDDATDPKPVKSEIGGNKKPLPRDLTPTGLKQETLLHYDAFNYRIKELEALIANEHPKSNIFVVFAGNYSSGPNGRSWCGLCTMVDNFIQREIVPRYYEKGYLLFVRVGDQDDWGDPNNPFRKDPRIKLKSVPAAMVWGTEKKLEGYHMSSGLLIKELFGIGIDDLLEGLKEKHGIK